MFLVPQLYLSAHVKMGQTHFGSCLNGTETPTQRQMATTAAADTEQTAVQEGSCCPICKEWKCRICTKLNLQTPLSSEGHDDMKHILGMI